MEAVLTMTPPFCFSKTGSVLRMTRMGPVRLVAITLSHNSSVTSPAGTSMSKMPALLTRMSSRPYVDTVVSTMRETSCSRATSAVTASACPRALRMVSAVFPAEIPSMSATTTAAPSLANRRAISRPMPDPAPVMSATLFASFPFLSGTVSPAAAARAMPDEISASDMASVR